MCRVINNWRARVRPVGVEVFVASGIRLSALCVL